MFKKIITISLILGLSNIAAYAKVKQEIGNQINEKEFPSSAKVLPVQPKKENPVVIEGSVQCHKAGHLRLVGYGNVMTRTYICASL